MVTQANNVIDTKTIRKRRADQRAVQSLARIETPPDTLAITSALQTTLDLEEMLAMFKRELAEHIEIDGITYRHNDSGVLIQQGLPGRNRASYGLHLHEEQLGELTLSRNEPFSEKSLALSEYLICPLLYPLRNALHYQLALRAAFLDPLTRLHNRAAMDETLPREIELARRHDLPISMLLVDLDHFKRINDTYGHAAGDCALRVTAERMQEVLRTTDHIFRYGGEEFVIVLTATDAEGATIVAERLRQAINASPCECDGFNIPLSASIGYAQMHDDDSKHTLFDRVDKALYQAKEEGRNRVVGR